MTNDLAILKTIQSIILLVISFTKGKDMQNTSNNRLKSPSPIDISLPAPA